MTSQPGSRWQRVQDLFDTAIELAGEERASFLEAETGGDHELLKEVTEMIAADDSAGEFLEMTVRDASLDFVGTVDGDNKSFGKYELMGWIGEGGFGQVHRGRDPVLQRDVAIKTCSSGDPDVRERFLREAKIAGSLQHPNIVTVHDIGFERGVSFIVQELLSGEDLSRKIAGDEVIPLETKLDYLRQIARGVDFAHRNGVLHRDIKPSNVQILESGRAKILDFGIARLIDDDSRLTSIGAAMGTAGYQAPELLQGEEVDARSDVFSFGVLAYELLAMQRPFAGKTFSEVSYRVLNDTPTSLRRVVPEVPAAVDRLVMRCLERKKARRYQSFDDIRSELEAIVAGSPVEEPRGRWPLALAAGVGVLVATGALWWFRPAAIPLVGSQGRDGWLQVGSVPEPWRTVASNELARRSDAAGRERLEPPPFDGSLDEPPSETERRLAGFVEASEGAGSSTPASRFATSEPTAAGSRSSEASVTDNLASSPSGNGPESGNRNPVEADAGSLKARELAEAARTPAESVPGQSGASQPASRAPGSGVETPGLQYWGDEIESPVEQAAVEDGDGPALPGEEDASLEATAQGSQPPPLVSDGSAVKTYQQIVNPVLIHVPNPVIPRKEFRRNQRALKVRVRVLVNEQGQVDQVSVSSVQGNRKVPEAFIESAKDAAFQARYEPGRRGDAPISAWTYLLFEFDLP